MHSLQMTPGADGGRFQMVDVERPQPTAEQVLIQVRAVALNRGELMVLDRMRSGTAVIGGIEFAGTVLTAPLDSAWQAGDRVMGHGRCAYADYVCADPKRLMRIPPGMSFTDAAAIPNVFMTAHDAMVTRAGIQAGDRVLVNAASSGIGTAATQIAAFMKASVIVGTSRSEAKFDAIRAFGATKLLAAQGDALAPQVLEVTAGAGVDIVIDCLGGATLQAHLHAMAIGGRLVSVGRLAGPQAQVDLDHLALRRLSIIGVTFRTRTEEETRACFQAFATDLAPGFASGALRAVVDTVFGFDDFDQAFSRLRSDGHAGKVVMALANDV